MAEAVPQQVLCHPSSPRSYSGLTDMLPGAFWFPKKACGLPGLPGKEGDACQLSAQHNFLLTPIPSRGLGRLLSSILSPSFALLQLLGSLAPASPLRAAASHPWSPWLGSPLLGAGRDPSGGLAGSPTPTCGPSQLFAGECPYLLGGQPRLLQPGTRCPHPLPHELPKGRGRQTQGSQGNGEPGTGQALHLLPG